MGDGPHPGAKVVVVQDLDGSDPVTLQDLTTINGGAVTEASSGHGVFSLDGG
jgi:hypothetical protein